MFRRACFIIVATLLLVLSCSRKGDESLPPRVGDLKVLFQFIDNLNHFSDMERVPVRITVYAADSVTLHISATVMARKDQTTSYTFEDLGAEITGNWIGLEADPSGGRYAACPDKYKVFVREGLLTSTNTIEIKYRPEEMICN